MTCNHIRNSNNLQSSMPMGPRIRIPIHNRGSHRNSPSKLINRYCITRHLLCSSTLPLCPISRSSVCNHGGICSMIPTIHRTRYKPKMTKGPIRRNIRSNKHNILPTTFPWISRNTTTILGLSRRLHYMKHHLINRVNNLVVIIECNSIGVG